MTSLFCSAVHLELVVRASQDYLGLNDVAPCEIILHVDARQQPALSPLPLHRLESLCWHFFFSRLWAFLNIHTEIMKWLRHYASTEKS